MINSKKKAFADLFFHALACIIFIASIAYLKKGDIFSSTEIPW
jgi:hypothetical protein